MRYYDIKLNNPSDGSLVREYTSFVNNQSLPGALDVEFDIPVGPFATPGGDAYVRVWGISVSDISQSANLAGMGISVFGGMQKGLPLANPAQAGLLVQGYVLLPFGNWIDTDQTLELVITPAPTKIQPTNITFNWQKGTSLSDAIASTLSTAFPSAKQNINISSNLILQQDEHGFYDNMVQFAQYLKARTAALIGGNYPGVDIFMSEAGFSVYDGTTQNTPKQLQYQDLIGQPTWIDPATVQAKFAMRSDIKIGDWIKFPQTLVISQANTVSPFVNQKLTFQGTFMVTAIRHVGRFRQASGDGWVTIINASTTPVAAS